MSNSHKNDIQELMGRIHPAMDEMLMATGYDERSPLQQEIIRCPKCGIKDIHLHSDDPLDEFLRYTCRGCTCRFGVQSG